MVPNLMAKGFGFELDEIVERFEHPLASRYASKAMVRLLSPLYRQRVWRRLWIALAESESELGLPVTAAQIAELIARHEAALRHDVMAAIHAWGEQAPGARPIIHLGATSCFVTDNGDLLITQEALQLLRRRLQDVIAALAAFAAQWQDQPTLGFTHFQPAQPTTVGKRACLWLQDLLLDLEDLDHVIGTTPVRGVKGVTGTQATFLELFEGDGAKVEELERRFCAKVGFPAIPVCGAFDKSGGGSENMCFDSSSASVSASNGISPLSISYRITPSE